MTSPSGAPRLYPTFRYEDPATMIEWLKEAFGFELRVKYDDETGGIMHAEMAFGPSLIMLGQARDDAYGGLVGRPGKGGGKSTYVAVDDADAAYDRAKAAGATILEELTDRSYGSREFVCADPEGHVWAFGTYRPATDEVPPAG